MADKSVGELVAATGVTPTDLFVLEQSGTAKKLTGQILENWLVSFADGHGGIQSIAKLSTSGLADTYRITLADTTTFDFVVTNGRSITGISKTSTSGLVDTYTISYNDGTTGTFTIKNGEKGDKGDNAYIWIKYASQEPTGSSHSMGDIPDDWIGIYSGNSSTAPTDWQQYKWYKIKGEKGDTGAPATIASQSVTYQVSDSGTIIPSGSWVAEIPVVTQGKFLWTKTELKFNTGDPIVSYSVARMGMDGSGSVSSVNNVSPDETGNVTMAAADVGALATSGGDMTGPINMHGQPISGLNDPVEENQAARKGYVDASISKPNLLDNPWFTVNQRGQTVYTNTNEGGSNMNMLDRWKIQYQGTTFTQGENSLASTSGNLAQLNQWIEYSTAKSWVGRTMTLSVLLDNPDGASVNLTLRDRTRWSHLLPQTGPFTGSGLLSTTGVFGQLNDGELVQLSIAVSANASVKIRAVKLEAGSVSTLENDAAPNYAEELAKCQRYYLAMNPLGGGTIMGVGPATNASMIRILVPTPVPMRIQKPAVECPEYVDFTAYGNGTRTAKVSKFEAVNTSQFGMTINCTMNSGVTQDQVYVVTNVSKKYFALNAEL